jgi:hypothetical protein
MRNLVLILTVYLVLIFCAIYMVQPVPHFVGAIP